MLRQCPYCFGFKKYDEFYYVKNRPDHCSSYCKKCTNEYQRILKSFKKEESKAYYQQNKEKILLYNLQYYEKNKQKVLKQQKRYRKLKDK